MMSECIKKINAQAIIFRENKSERKRESLQFMCLSCVTNSGEINFKNAKYLDVQVWMCLIWCLARKNCQKQMECRLHCRHFGKRTTKHLQQGLMAV